MGRVTSRWPRGSGEGGRRLRSGGGLRGVEDTERVD
jgi:hypothetical protein